MFLIIISATTIQITYFVKPSTFVYIEKYDGRLIISNIGTVDLIGAASLFTLESRILDKQF